MFPVFDDFQCFRQPETQLSSNKRQPENGIQPFRLPECSICDTIRGRS
ncbi:hypothetical protein ACKLNO_00800 [Neisseriaceae bacterium B1]